jgi:hypothetical protein
VMGCRRDTGCDDDRQDGRPKRTSHVHSGGTSTIPPRAMTWRMNRD